MRHPPLVVVERARPYSVQHHLSWQANGRSAWAVHTARLPILVCHTRSSAAVDTASLVVADRASNCAVEDRWDSTELSKDLLPFLRQTSCCAAHDRLDGDHQACWKETDLMFAPYQRAHPVHLAGSGLADRRRKTAECTRETSLTAPTAAGRNSSLVSRTTRSLRTCSLRLLGTAQQMLDLQRLQTDVRCTARKVSSNLTAGIPAAYHPLTVDGLGVCATRVSRLATNRYGSG